MATKKTPASEAPKKRKKALTPEARENQIIALVIDVEEERIRNGQATAQELIHWMKLASAKARLEQKKLENENLLIQAKVDAIKAQQNTEELYKKALAAMRSYQGEPEEEDYDDYDEY